MICFMEVRSTVEESYTTAREYKDEHDLLMDIAVEIYNLFSRKYPDYEIKIVDNKELRVYHSHKETEDKYTLYGYIASDYDRFEIFDVFKEDDISSDGFFDKYYLQVLVNEFPVSEINTCTAKLVIEYFSTYQSLYTLMKSHLADESIVARDATTYHEVLSNLDKYHHMYNSIKFYAGNREVFTVERIRRVK